MEDNKNPYYDFMELSDLLIRLKESSEKGASGKDHNNFVYFLLLNNNCDWESILEDEHNLSAVVPQFFTDFEDLPLMINSAVDEEGRVLIQWRLDLGK